MLEAVSAGIRWSDIVKGLWLCDWWCTM